MACPDEVKRDGLIHSEFIASAARCMSTNSSYALKHYINDLCANILGANGLKLKKEKKNEKCNHCVMPWENGCFSVKLVPGVRRGRKVRALLRRKNALKKTSKIQEKLISTMNYGNTVVIKCHICQKFSKIKARKDINHAPSKSTPVTEIKKEEKKADTLQNVNAEQNVMTKSSRKKNSKKRKGKKKHLKAGKDINIGPTEKCGTDKNKTSFTQRKRKIGSSKNSDIFEYDTSKLRIVGNRVPIKVPKSNPLAITPLGLSNATPEICKPSLHTSKMTYISFDMKNDNSARPKKKTTKAKPQKKINTVLNKDNRNIIINPYSQVGIDKSVKRNCKKLKSLKMLIAAEENKPAANASLRYFLSTV